MPVSNTHQVINMAKHFSPRPVFLITFLIASFLLTSARDIHPREISLVREPDENYYILKKSTAVIVCQAKNAADIVFNCSGTQIPPTSVEVKDVSDIDPELIQAEIEVTRADLQNHEGQSPFWCECSALDIGGQVAVTSRRARISIAHLKNKFEVQPKSAVTTVGDEVIFECEAPEGQPKPEIMWRKDKKRLEFENNPRFSVTEKGSLIIQSVMTSDKGYYQCVARNIAGRRESEEALLSVTALAELAEPDLELSEGGSSGKKSGGGKLRATRQSIKTYFTTEPQEKYFVTQEKPLVIDCGVVAADILTFRCNGKRMDRSRQTINQGLDTAGNRVIQSQLNITYADVQAFLSEFGDKTPFHCICVAWFQDGGVPNGWGMMNSQNSSGFVYLAYLDEAFKTEPSDVTAGLNTDATFACEPPKGQPNPWVYWYKDGARLDPRSSEKYSVNDKGYLTIHDVQYEDAGAYSCLAENLVTSVKSRTGTLTVTEEALTATTAAPSEDDVPPFPSVIPTTPVFLRDFEAENVLGPDDTKAMVCAVVSAEQITIDCGGQRLAADDYELKQNLHRESGKRLLYVKAVITADRVASKPDDYFCQCIAWYLNDKMAWERIASTKGYIRPSPVASYIGTQFEVVPADTDAHFESEAQLVCRPPEGNPTPTIYWLKDGVRIDPEHDANYVVNEGTLFIEYVRATDEGQYTCVAENEAGTLESQPIQFTVIGKPELPTDAPGTEVETTTLSEEDQTESVEGGPVFTQELDDEYYISDEHPVTLHCGVLSVKTLLFVCNGLVLKETATTGDSFVHPITMETIRSNHLTITREQFDEYEGTTPYTCLCRAFYQKDGTDVQADSSPATIYLAYIGEEFAVEPSETEVTNLGRLELPCQPPEAVPEPEISWLKGGQQVVEDDRITIEDSGTLVIEEFSVDDEGYYSCVANNSFDTKTSREAFVSLAVTGGPIDEVTQPYDRHGFKTDAPEPEPETSSSEPGNQQSDVRYISKDLHSVYYLVKNQPVTLTCEAYNVDFIEFYCGNEKQDDQDVAEREEELSSPDGSVNLVKVVQATISVTKEDVEEFGAGQEYWCQCAGNYRVPGIEQYQKILSVKGIVEVAHLKKNFQKEPENQTVMVGDSLTIQCQPPAGNPPPKVYWTKDEKNVEALSIAPSGVLIIPEVQLEHAGVYICIAENDAGKRMSQPIKVDVKGKGGTPPIKGGIEGNECAQMLSSCSNLLPRNANHVEYCEAVQDYSACVENYFQKCTGIINEISMNAVKMAYMDTREKCTLKTKCQRLQECRTISSNLPDTSVEQTGLSFEELCRETSTFLQCVDQNLADCNVTKNPPEEDVRGSLQDVDDWFDQFCTAVTENSRELESCDEVASCSLHIEQVAGDNSTYWCSLINSLLKCTASDAGSCSLDEQDYSKLRNEANDLYCS
ncbi:unnamed protein product, partial [Candidula unifasciata]